jgi:hypothetical protein
LNAKNDDVGERKVLPSSPHAVRRVLFEQFWSASKSESRMFPALHAPPPREERVLVCTDHDECAAIVTNNDASSSSSTTTTVSDMFSGLRRTITVLARVLAVSPCSPSRPSGTIHQQIARPRSNSDSSCFYSPTLSCLRRSRFAGVGLGPPLAARQESSERSLASETTSVVSFDDHVQIVTFDKPVEHWASEGWMDYFA